MTRLRAFAIHLAISATIVGAVLWVIFYVWYPHPYFAIAGASNVVRILVSVDLVLGPALTLLLFKPGKPRLVFDMCVVAAIQIAALIYGTVTIHSEKPLFMVYVVDRFSMLSGNDVDPADVPAALSAERPARGPLLAVALQPESPKERETLLFELLDGAPDIEYRPWLWHRFSDNRHSVLARARPLTELAAAGNDAQAAIARVRKRSGPASGDLVFVPVVNKALDALALVLDSETAEPVDVIAIDPYTLKYSEDTKIYQ